jgi:hypothetical protein
MSFSHIRQFLADRLEQLASLLAADTYTCSLKDNPSVTAVIYSFDGPDAFQAHSEYFPDLESAQDWLIWQNQYDRTPSSWSHGVISGDTFVAFNDSGATPRRFTFCHEGTWKLTFRVAGLNVWSLLSDSSN